MYVLSTAIRSKHGTSTRGAKRRALEEDLPMVTYKPPTGSKKSTIVIRVRDYNLLEDQVGYPIASVD